MKMPAEYVPLRRRGSSEERTLHEPLLKENVDPTTQPSKYSSLTVEAAVPNHQTVPAGVDRLLVCSSAAVAVTTLLSLLLFFSALFATQVDRPQVDAPPVRPNPYVYLDKILRNTTRTFPPIVNFPQVVLQIDDADSSRSTREFERGRATAFGTIYPDDRRILIFDTASTYVCSGRNRGLPLPLPRSLRWFSSATLTMLWKTAS